MGDTRSLDDTDCLQLNRINAQVVEQPDTLPEQDWHQVDTDFVEQPCPQALLDDMRAADTDVLVHCNLLCLFNGAFDAIRDEGERRSFLHPFLRDIVGHDKDRRAQRVFAALRARHIKHSASRHNGPGGSDHLLKNLGALG